MKKKKSYAIKRNNSYTCIATSRFRFLDMSQFIAPGTSYAKFLKAYGVEEEKGFFLMNGLTALKNLIIQNYQRLETLGFQHLNRKVF